MRAFAIILIAPLLAGCMASGPTPDQRAAMTSERAINRAEAAAHKITFVEAANRDNALIQNMSGGNLTGDDQLVMSLRVALASQVDAHQITPEIADYQIAAKTAEIEDRNSERRRQAIADLGNAIAAAHNTAPISRPVTCNSNAFGTSYGTSANVNTTTTCY